MTIAYNTSKGADVNFVRTLASEWGRYNINVNAICPGFFPSKMASGLLEKLGDQIINGTALRRVGGPEDLKGLIVLLASEAGRHITRPSATAAALPRRLHRRMKHAAVSKPRSIERS
jgi:NAD(P)-dependent dehydrogenase (short-subunit alcohol dehydrogenase family)